MNNSFNFKKYRIVNHVVQHSFFFTAITWSLIILLKFSLAILPTFAYADEEYNKDLEEQAYEFIYDLAKNETPPEDKIEIDLSSIPRGTNYPICEGEVEFELAGNKIRRNNSIKISCKSKTTPYYFYLTAKLTISAPFVTVVSAVPKGTILTRDTLTISYINKVLDRGTAFNDITELEGVKTKRDLKPGNPISKNQICVICRGDEVLIEATHGSLSVRTKGEALQDGSYNDKIRVKNLKSSNIVRGIVIDKNTVSVENR